VGCCLSVWHRMDALWRLTVPSSLQHSQRSTHTLSGHPSVDAGDLVHYLQSGRAFVCVPAEDQRSAGAVSADCSLEWAG